MAFRGIMGEFKVLFTEVGDGAKVKKKMMRLGVPTVTATAVTTAGLYYHKHSGAAPSAPARLEPQFEHQPRITLPAAHEEKIRTAALRGCPVEQDCITAIRGLAEPKMCTMDGMIDAWDRAGYFHDPTTDRDVIGELYMDPSAVSAYGKDVNAVSATQNAFAGPYKTWDAASIAQGLEALDDRGYCVVNGAVSCDLIEKVRHKLEVPAFHGQKDADHFEVRRYEGLPIECEMIKPSAGRRHFLLRKTEFEDILAPLLSTVCPLVQAYLSKHQMTRKPYLSELQLAVTEPLAVQQFWHRDNVTPGLTISVPLMDVPPCLGQTALLPHSHRHSLHSVVGEHTEHLSAGDVLIYDARLLHKGKRNETYNKTRLMVVFRYDFEPPPGQGVVMTALNAIVGNVLNGIGCAYKKLP